MNIELMDFVAQAERLVPNPSLRSKVIASAIAAAIATKQSLPSTEVEYSAGYYVQQVLPAVMALVSAFNEEVVFNTTDCLAQTSALWRVRYTAAHGPYRFIVGLDGCNFLDNFTGVSVMVSKQQREHFDANCNAIGELTMFASNVLSQMSTAKV